MCPFDRQISGIDCLCDQVVGGLSEITIPSSDSRTALYLSGVRLVGLMFPAPPWMMSRGFILGEDWTGRLYSML